MVIQSGGSLTIARTTLDALKAQAAAQGSTVTIASQTTPNLAVNNTGPGTVIIQTLGDLHIN